jgi:hypothetical protein
MVRSSVLKWNLADPTQEPTKGSASRVTLHLGQTPWFRGLIHQVRPLRSSVITAFLAPRDRSDFSTGRTNLPRGRGCVRGWARRPTSGDLIPYTLNRPTRSVPADPAVVLAGELVVSGLSRSRRDCRPPVLAAFTVPKLAGLYGSEN